MFFILRISFLISDSLEHAWGDIRTSAYVYGTIICQTLVLFTVAKLGLPTLSLGSPLFYLALFFAFATLFPDYEFAIFLVIPVKVWILAVLSAVLLFLSSLFSIILIPVYLFCFLPYLVWAIPRLRSHTKLRKQLSVRRVDYQAKAKSLVGNSLHSCHICQRTEQSDPELEFRVAADGEEYCLDHLDEEGNPRPS